MNDVVVHLDVTFHTDCWAWCVTINDASSDTGTTSAWGDTLQEAYDDLIGFLGYDPRYMEA